MVVQIPLHPNLLLRPWERHLSSLAAQFCGCVPVVAVATHVL